ATVESLRRKRSSASIVSVASVRTPCRSSTATLRPNENRSPRSPENAATRAVTTTSTPAPTATRIASPRRMGCRRATRPDAARRLALALLGLGHHVGEGELTPLPRVLQVLVHLGPLLALAQGLDGEADSLLAGVDVGDLGLDHVARLEERRGLVDALGGELGDVDQPLDPLLQLDEDAEVGDAGDRALDPRTDGVAARYLAPRVFRQLLDAERDALVVDVDAEHHGLHLLALLVELGGVLHLLRPVQVGDVDQAVDVLLDLDEEPEVRDALDLAADVRADRVVDAHHLPRVRLGLLEPERDAAVGRVDVEDLDVDLLVHLEQLRGMGDALGPGHLGDVDQPLHAALDLDEGAVVGQAHDLAADAGVQRQPLGDRRPRVRHDLLHAERDALALGVV